MEFTQNDKAMILKRFSDYFKSIRGKGPRNIYAKYYDHEVHIHFEGALNVFEKQLLEHFEEDVSDVLVSFYKRIARATHSSMTTETLSLFNLTFKELVCDLENDQFVYVLEKVQSKHELCEAK